MKLFSAKQIRDWDNYTIQNEPISSYDLMERAAERITEEIGLLFPETSKYAVLCGSGNNGGDGLAVARMLYNRGNNVEVYLLLESKKVSLDTVRNLQKLPSNITRIEVISEIDLKNIAQDRIIVDAIFGSGLTRPLKGFYANCINKVNSLRNVKVSIDLPSGLPCDNAFENFIAVKADYTFTIQQPKLSFLLPESGYYVGKWKVVNIDLSDAYYQKTDSLFYIQNLNDVKAMYNKRDSFAHKGSFGHSLIIAGEFGKVGAAVLCTKSCLHSGVGLVTALIPRCGYDILQMSVPEAMVICGQDINSVSDANIEWNKYSAIAIGCGIGTGKNAINLFGKALREYTNSLVIDADALNILAEQKEYWNLIKPNTIITPHPKEFDRLFGYCNTSFERVGVQIEMAKKHQLFIVLKGHYTSIATPEGKVYFNNSGNAGMSTGGSGDVLAGLIAGLLSQKYPPFQACIMGVFIHGLAGDIAVTQKQYSEESLSASAIIEQFGLAFKYISK